MLAALHTISDVKKNHRLAAVLGDMLELGLKTTELHRMIGKSVAQLGFHFLAAFGPHANDLVGAAVAAGMPSSSARPFTSKEELAGWLQQLTNSGRLAAGDWVLIKGSRAMQMENVLELLRKNENLNPATGN